MIFLYTLLLLLLGGIRWLVGRRALGLEKRYSKAALAVSKLTSDLTWKSGNGKVDVCAIASRQYQLGAMVQKRDRLERKCLTWRGLTDRLTRADHNLRAWKGKKLPYTLGAVDVWLALAVVDHLGFAELIRPGKLLDIVLVWVNGS